MRHLVMVEHDVTRGRLRPVLLQYRDSHAQLEDTNLLEVIVFLNSLARLLRDETG
jgi:hypothetical protein